VYFPYTLFSCLGVRCEYVCNGDPVICSIFEGECVFTEADGRCDDGNNCTQNHCRNTSGCVFVVDDGLECSDSDVCTQDSCVDGAVMYSGCICEGEPFKNVPFAVIFNYSPGS
jgi:slime mold repeat-containing protein